MGTNITPANLRGFLLPHEMTSAQIWTAQATYTEADKKSGDALASTGSKLVIETTGTQSENIEIKTQKGGTAGESGGFVWRAPDTSADYFGETSPQVITGFEYLEYYNTPSKVANPPSALAVSDGSILVAWQNSGTTDSGIRVKRKAPGAATFSAAVTVYNNTTAALLGETGISPALCELPDGSILLVHWVTRGVETAQLYSHRSTDKGASWTQVSSGALRIPSFMPVNPVYVTNELGRLWIAEYQGQIMLIGEVISSGVTVPAGTPIKNALFQAASVDEGTSFIEVGGLNKYLENENIYQPSMFRTGSGFGLTYIQQNRATLNFDLVYVELPHAFFPLSDRSSLGSYLTLKATINGYTLTGGSPDEFNYGGSASWTDAGQGVSDSQPVVFNVNTLTTTLSSVVGIAANGRNCLFSNFAAAPGVADLSLVACYLGGWTDLCLPSTIQSRTGIANRSGMERVWLPFDFPDTSPLFAVSGGGSASLDSDGLDLDSTTVIGQEKYYTGTFLTPSTVGAVCSFAVRADAGGSIASDQRAWRMIWDDAAFKFDFSIRISTTQIRVRDNQGAADLATVTVGGAILSTSGAEFVLAVKRNSTTNNVYLSVWYRGLDQVSPKNWTNILNHQLLATIAGGAPSRSILWGHLGIPTLVNMESHWTGWSANFTQGDRDGLSDGLPLPAPRPYPRTSQYAYITEGLFITSKDGPAFEGDTYTIAPRSDYAIDRIFYASSPSPAVQWRSEAAGAGSSVPENFIPILWDSALTTQDSDPGCDLIAIHLSGINFRRFKIEANSGGSWIVLADVSTAAGDFSLANYARNGSSFIGNDGAKKPYFFHQEAQNFIIQTDTGGATPITVFRRVSQNTSGVFHQSATVKRGVLQASGVQSSDPTSGDFKLLPDRVTIIISLAGTKFSALGIRILSQKTIDDDFRIGQLLAGPVAVVAPQYGRGRSISYEPNTELLEQQDGTLRGRKLGDGRRVLSVAWSDPVDMSAFFPFDSTADPDYFQGRSTIGAEAVANYGSVPFDSLGYLREMAGAFRPVVYLPKVPVMDAVDTWRMMRRYSEHLPGVIDGDISIDHVVGDELSGGRSGEAFRVSTVTLREII